MILPRQIEKYSIFSMYLFCMYCVRPFSVEFDTRLRVNHIKFICARKYNSEQATLAINNGKYPDTRRATNQLRLNKDKYNIPSSF